MADYGVKTTGFIRKPYSTIQTDIENNFREEFGYDIDLSVYSPAGYIAQILAWNTHLLWQELEKAYYANWLDTAEGLNLDRIVQWGGMSRENQKAMLAGVKFSRESGVVGDIVIPLGTVIRTDDSDAKRFRTLEEKTMLAAANEVTINCQALVAGEEGGKVEADIDWAFDDENDTVEGIDSIENPAASEGYDEMESDADLRARYKESAMSAKSSSISGIEIALNALENVISARVYENTSLLPDDEGRPPKSVECVVYRTEYLDANDQDKLDVLIAQTIYDTKPAGIETFASEVSAGNDPNEYIIQSEIIDDNGGLHPILFRVPENFPVNITVSVTLDENMALSQTELGETIKENIEAYLEDIKPGGTVSAWKLLMTCSAIEGILDMSVEFVNADPEKPGQLTVPYNTIPGMGVVSISF